MQLQRLSRLSDLIFAVAMTIMALTFEPLPMKEMTPQEVTTFLQEQLPSFTVYALTFIGIAFYWGMFLNFVDYKAKRDGKTFLEIDRFFPSSKTCNVCLNVVESLPLDIRQWECHHCHTQHDRDINAAINIRAGWIASHRGAYKLRGRPTIERPLPLG